MRLFKTTTGVFIEQSGVYYALGRADWDELFNRKHLLAELTAELPTFPALRSAIAPENLLPPIANQEIWGAGVTYFRSRDARMEESKAAGGGDFYAKVYEAERPELFIKATPHRVVGTGQKVRIRRDSKWNVPEPELTLAINSRGRIFGYTIGNDMSSRDIEGENPLYLPQAKVFDQCCALGPGILLTDEPLPPTTEIRLQIRRKRDVVFNGATSLAKMKRNPKSLVEFLYRESSFPKGCLLLTGTGVVPPDSFTLQAGDEVQIGIEPIGVLVNTVSQGSRSERK